MKSCACSSWLQDVSSRRFSTRNLRAWYVVNVVQSTPLLLHDGIEHPMRSNDAISIGDWQRHGEFHFYQPWPPPLLTAWRGNRPVSNAPTVRMETGNAMGQSFIRSDVNRTQRPVSACADEVPITGFRAGPAAGVVVRATPASCCRTGHQCQLTVPFGMQLESRLPHQDRTASSSSQT